MSRLIAEIKIIVNRLVGFYFKRPFQRYNIEDRTEKLLSKIEKDKPQSAPKYEKDSYWLSRLYSDNPEIAEEVHTKKEDLLSRLKSVWVRSIDSLNTRTESNMKKLPYSRTAPALYEYGPHEPPVISEGKLTLRQFIEATTNLTGDLHEDATNMVENYKLDFDNAVNILTYFRPLHYHKTENSFRELQNTGFFGMLSKRHEERKKQRELEAFEKEAEEKYIAETRAKEALIEETGKDEFGRVVKRRLPTIKESDVGDVEYFKEHHKYRRQHEFKVRPLTSVK